MRIFFLVAVTLVTFCGCAEGPLWKIGGYLPWVQAKWAAEEQISETVHSKKQKIRRIAKRSSAMTETEKEETIIQLSQFLNSEKIIQLRVDALYALGELNTQSAENLIRKSLQDPATEVRIAAVNALANRRTPSAGKELIRVIGSDTDKDVRASAIRAVANYPGDQTVDALAQILNEPEPALQYAAMQSLDAVTDSSIGANITQWKQKLSQRHPQTATTTPVEARGF